MNWFYTYYLHGALLSYEVFCKYRVRYFSGIIHSKRYRADFANYKCLVGLDDELETSVSTKIYPNPASDIAEVMVMDLAGRIIGNYVIDKGENKLEIDVRRFAKGVYNVLVQNKEIGISKKLVVE